MTFAARLPVALAAIAVALLLAAAPARENVALGASGEHQVAFGMFTPGAPENPAAIQSFIRKVGRSPVIWHTYRSWDEDPFPRNLMQNPADVGAVPMITWEPHDHGLRDMARGHYDSYIRDSAREAVAWGRPILLRFAHEMNGDWYSWGTNGNSASDYVAAWRHVVRVFREENANNVRWVWAPNTGSFESFFPGDGFVDYIGLDGYNFGAKYGQWESFEQVFDSSYRSITHLSRRPLLITEFSANPRGGDKAAWIRHALSSAVTSRYPRMRALIWFDRDQGGIDWRVDSSADTLDAFRSGIHSSRFDLSAEELLGLPDSGSPAPPVTQPAQHRAARMTCGVHPRRALRMSRMWTIPVSLRCNRSGSKRCFGVIKVKQAGSGKTLGVAAVRLWQGLSRPVRIGLPGWARSSLVGRYRLAARVTLRTHAGCGAGPARRVTLKR
ncbi:MAG: hypothetical protein QOD53_2371 [Thermoleophilaceae bacterium]|nr:hypothetical protein [Thermoleophilaceae bacterium]